MCFKESHEIQKGTSSKLKRDACSDSLSLRVEFKKKAMFVAMDQSAGDIGKG